VESGIILCRKHALKIDGRRIKITLDCASESRDAQLVRILANISVDKPPLLLVNIIVLAFKSFLNQLCVSSDETMRLYALVQLLGLLDRLKLLFYFAHLRGAVPGLHLCDQNLQFISLQRQTILALIVSLLFGSQVFFDKLYLRFACRSKLCLNVIVVIAA